MRRGYDDAGMRPPAGTPVAAVIDDLVDAERLRDEWRELADACEAGPVARPTFALHWWQHLGEGSLRVVTVREADRLVALAPLHARRAGPVRVVRWLGHGLGSVAEALVRPGHEHAADLLWRTAAGRGAVLDLVECDERGPLPSGNGGLRSVTTSPRDACPVIDVSGDAEAHLAAPARKRVRRTVRVARRRLEEAGTPFTTVVADDAATLAAVLPDVRRVFDAAEAAQPRQHLLTGPWADFTEAVLREGVASGEVVVLVGYIGDAPAVFDVVFVSARATAVWLGRFDPDAARFSPGHLLQCAGIDWAHAHGKAHIDLLLGDSYYKRLWAERAYGTLDVQAGPPSARRLLGALSRLRAP
jgi:CelD/BcsL family acetyltransferase involved in cellulose biosynthesis